MRFDVRLTAIAVSLCLATLIQCADRNPPAAAVGPLPEVDLSTLDPKLSDQLATKLAVVRANPKDVSANGEVAKLLHAYQQLELAVQFYQRAETLEPTGLRWPYYLGVIRASEGRYDEAIASFNSVLAMDPTNLPAEKRLARALLDDGKLDESLSSYKALLVYEPADPEIRRGIGGVHAALGNTEEAVAHLVRAVQILPNYGEAHYALALAYRDLGDEESAAAHFKRYEEDKFSAPSGVDPLMTAVRSLNRKAIEYLRAGVEAERAGRIPEAIAYNLQALELDPSLHQVHASLIVLYAIVGESDSSRLHYQKALALSPDSVVVHYNYGRFSYDKGDYKQASLSFQRALELNPEDAFTNNDMGQTIEQFGRLDEAIRYYRRAIANRPDYGHAHFNLGRTMMQKGRTAEAISEFRLALREETFRTPTYLVTLASAYISLGRMSEAAEMLDLARRMAQQYGQDDVVNDINRLAARSAR
ncbi:MAG: tetratricopeptide repeat protein [Acidobacteria bacterium]|nr:tetratricopeptide repeat protein [Acidobacteriota bacterium]MDA1236719.1 tetratricopeptide repeat protein [Acidobacteriota bacterium]